MRTVGVVFLAIAVGLGIGPGTLGGTLLSVLAGFGVGVIYWAFDGWWGNRPSVRPVGGKGAEFRRRFPGLIVWAVGVVVGLIILGWQNPYSGTFMFSAIAAECAFVLPRLRRRDAAKRFLRAMPPPPGLLPPPPA
jgi:hypothetical protein